MSSSQIIRKKLLISLGIFLFSTMVNVIVCVPNKAPLVVFLLSELFVGSAIFIGTFIGIKILLKKNPLEFNDEREVMLAKQADLIALHSIFAITLMILLVTIVYSYASGIKSIEVPVMALNILMSLLVLLCLGIRFAALKIIK